MKKSLGILRVILFSFLFTCSCSKENQSETVVNNPPPPPPPSNNKPPRANGGPNQTIYVPRDSVFINIRASRDDDGNVNSYSLTQISGPTLSTIDYPPVLMGFFRVRNLIAGFYNFELKVTDNQGAIGTDIIQVEVIQGPPSGTEYILHNLIWKYDLDWNFNEWHVLKTPDRPDIFPPNAEGNDLVQFPADIYLLYDTATIWRKLPPVNSVDNVNKIGVYFNKKTAEVFDWREENLDGRKASLRIKFH